jgi:Flp pilus assembly pilin Flp
MRTLRERFNTFRRDDSGQDVIEYAVLLCLIAVSSTVLFPDLGSHVRSIYGRAATVLERSNPNAVRSAGGPIASIDNPTLADRTESTPRQRR